MIDCPPKVLLTGRPGCGKTTLIRRVLDGISFPASGFYTEEVRGPYGKRTGFDVITLSGKRGSLARVGLQGPRVGRYGVTLDFLEDVAIPEFDTATDALLVMDEIGKMECLSGIFRETVLKVLAGHSPLLGSIALGGAPLIRKVRSMPEVEIVEVTGGNRERLVEKIREKVESGK